MDNPKPPPPHPLNISDFRKYCLARAASELATSGMVVILGYQLYDVARRVYGMSIRDAAFQLGLFGLAQFLPLFILTPVAGVVADRYDRRRVVALAMTADLVIASVLTLVTLWQMVSLPLLFALAAAHGTARVFVRPAMSAIPPNVVPAELLPRSIALSSIAMQVGTIGGPALAGILFGIYAAAPYAVAVGLLALGVVTISAIRPIAPHPGNRAVHPLRQVADGFAYIRSERFLLGCITLDLFAVLLGGATALLPVYARDILQVGPVGLGQMRAAPAVGAAVVALMLSARPLARNVGVKMLWAVAIYGAATVIFGLSRWYPLSLAMLVTLGAADMISVFIRNSLVQLRTPDDKRGRISAISGLAISASNELGEMESGVAAAVMGAPGAVVFGGVAAILITMLWAWRFPEIRLARHFSQAREQEPSS